jgi:ribosome assembly protein RRB1
MGEFEDAWEDELESDEDVTEANDDNGEIISIFCRDYVSNYPGMDVDEGLPSIDESEETQPSTRTFIPGVHSLGRDEVLEPDESAYNMLQKMGVDWPCLSFDVLRDNLGDQRQRFPATAYIVAGTQAAVAKDNKVVVYKMSSLHKTQKDGSE